MCMDKIAANITISKALSTVAPGGTADIGVDILQVPQGMYAVIKALSVRWVGTISSPCPTVFACDQSYSFGASALDSNGQFDTTKAGVALTASDETNPSATNIMTSLMGAGENSVAFAGDFILTQNWFLRIYTQSGTTGGPSANAQFEVQVMYAFLPLPC
jgi:hypothetical protein